MKIKQWIKEHKKEIMIGVLSAGCTALYFISKEKSNKGINAGLSLNLSLTEGFKDGSLPYYEDGEKVYLNFDMYKPDIKIDDLGKLGGVLKDNIPLITSDTKIDKIYTSFNKKLNKED